MFSRKFSNTIRRKKRMIISGIITLVLILGIGYSAFFSDFTINGSLDVVGHMEPTLYNVLKKEAVTGGLAREYTGEHGDSMDSTKSTEKIYHWYAEYASDDSERIQNKNNVIFAGQCWQMIRTTDTGGVKMIYNGEAENNKCLNTRGNHVGYAARTSQSLNSNYWYGTDYTYDKINNVFSISGTIEQAVWNATTGPDLIGKYTCKQTTEAGTCSTLYLVESYQDTSKANVIPLNSNSHYSQFGTLQYNGASSSPTFVGYMYGDIYSSQFFRSVHSQSFINYQYLFGSPLTFSDTYLYSKTISFDGTNYTLDNPVLGSSIPEDTYVGYYTFMSNNIVSASQPYYLVGSASDTYYYYVHLSATNQLSNYDILIGDSITDNLDGTYTINNTSTISPIDWYTNYENYSNKYICEDSSAITCTNPRLITTTRNICYYYISVKEKIIIARSRSGLNLVDTLAVTKEEWQSNYSNYSDYKYTCNNENTTCTEDSLRLIITYNLTGYDYAPNHYYGTGALWNGTSYTLQNTIDLENYDNSDNLSTHHYVCVSEGLKVCQEVAFIFEVRGDYIYYITLKNGVETASKALEDMFTKNLRESIIKKGIDAWYKKYILTYDSKVEDTIFCNNRSIKQYGGWEDNGNIKYEELAFGTDDLSCNNITDQFSVSNASALLNYKVGLITAPELDIIYNSSAFRTGKEYWLNSPYKYSYGTSHYSSICTKNLVWRNVTSTDVGVRPVISLKSGTEYNDGNGSMEKPYFVDEVYNITNSNNLFKIREKAAPNYEVQIYSNDYIVTAFKLNGTLVNGDTFIMPEEDVTITDIQYIQANYAITNTDNDITVPSTGRYGSTIILKTNSYTVLSFKLNGTLIEGDSFVMPSENVTITEIIKIPQVTVESEHNPYANNIDNVIYYENTFDGASSITVELTYQTEGVSYDWIYLYDSSGGSPIGNKKYGGSTLTTETITINSNYLKILFRTDGGGNNYYGFKAVIYPNYD